jgi:hypothetical protein
MNFTADLVITDSEGNVLGGFEDLPISEIISHHQNKELNLVTHFLGQNHFPKGITKYCIRFMMNPLAIHSKLQRT